VAQEVAEESTLIRREPLSRAVAKRILGMILDRRFVAGQRLPPAHQLCRMLGVSLTALREGLQQLQTLGVVDIRHGEGVFVCHVSMATVFENALPISRLVELKGDDLRSVFQTRQLIETTAAAQAAQHAKPEHLRRLQGLLAEMERLLPDPEVTDPSDLSYRVTMLASLGTDFHVAIAEASGNSLFPAIVRNLNDTYVRLRQATPVPHEECRRDYEQHRGIAEAIVTRAPSLARKLMKQHIDWSARVEFERADFALSARASAAVPCPEPARRERKEKETPVLTSLEEKGVSKTSRAYR